MAAARLADQEDLDLLLVAGVAHRPPGTLGGGVGEQAHDFGSVGVFGFKVRPMALVFEEPEPVSAIWLPAAFDE